VSIPGNWDFPKGGLKPHDNDLKSALLRELQEETGSCSYTILHEFDEKITFDFPPELNNRYTGQETTMFLVEYTGDGSDLQPQDEEIDRVEFFSQEHVLELIPFPESQAFFKRRVSMQPNGNRISWTQQQLEEIELLEEMFRKREFTDFRWIETSHIVVAQWVRMKCMFGCGDYGQCAACPPNVPTVAECERFFSEYTHTVILGNPEERHKWSAEVNAKLLQLEREVFLAGYHKAFLLFMDNCHLCQKCPGEREECKQPKQARPTPEGMAIDVFSTVRAAGYPIQVLSDYSQPMNRYAFLFVE
jgi:predicted metal-binding protein/ADP-ribose pyrophosphatase YjhB (NUDIX family)